MRVTVDVKGEETHAVELPDGPQDREDGVGSGENGVRSGKGEVGSGENGVGGGEKTAGSVATGAESAPTYADLLAAVDLSPHEVSVLVDGRPVPEDQPVEVDHVTVLRLVKGG